MQIKECNPDVSPLVPVRRASIAVIATHNFIIAYMMTTTTIRRANVTAIPVKVAPNVGITIVAMMEIAPNRAIKMMTAFQKPAELNAPAIASAIPPIIEATIYPYMTTPLNGFKVHC